MAPAKQFRIKGVTIVKRAGSSGQGETELGCAAVLSLVYASGQRPTLGALAELTARPGAMQHFSISHMPQGDAVWAELLSAGLTYDCRGLAPGEPAPPPGRGTMLGLPEIPEGEAITLEPAPHLAEGRGLLPVVKVLAGVGAELAHLPGLTGVFWQPARCWMTAKYFRGVVAEWLGGGAFPALGLTALQREKDGAMVSAGLDFLIGQELRFEPDRRLVPAAIARIAMRVIHSLIESGPQLERADYIGPDGERLLLEPIKDGRQLRVLLRK
jgi:hypothetical protein